MSEIDDRRLQLMSERVSLLSEQVADQDRQLLGLLETTEALGQTLKKTTEMNKHLYETVFALASLTVVIPRVVKPSSEEDGEVARERATKLISEVHQGLQASYNAYWPSSEDADGSEH